MESKANVCMKGRFGFYAITAALCLLIVVFMLLPGSATGRDRVEVQVREMDVMPPPEETFVTLGPGYMRLWGYIVYVNVSTMNDAYICYALLAQYEPSEHEFKLKACYGKSPRLQSMFELAVAKEEPIELWGKMTDPPEGMVIQDYPIYEIGQARVFFKDLALELL